MKDAIAKLGKHTLIYGFGSIATKLIAFLLLPLYTAYLSPADYGLLQICNTLSAFLLVVYQMGMTSSMFKVYFSEENENNRIKIFSSVFWFYLIVAGAITVVLIMLRKPLSSFLISTENGQYLYIIVVLSVYLEGAINLGLSILRAKERSTYYGFISIIRVVFYAGINILFITVFNRGYIGVREAAIVSMIIALLVLIPIFSKNIKVIISKKYLKEILYLGIPLAIGGMGLWVLNLTDRYMIKFLLPESIALTQVGLYSFGAKFAQLIKFILVIPFSLSWGALMFSYQKKDNAKYLYSKVFGIFVFTGGFLALIISVFGKDIILLISSNLQYLDSYRVIPILAFSSVLVGTNLIFTVGVTLSRKTKYITYSNISAAILNVLLNFILIPHYGMIGAAVASLFSFIVMNIILYYFAQKCYYIPYAFYRGTLYLVTIGILISICIYLDLPLMIKLLLAILATIFLPLFKLVTYNDLVNLFVYLKRRLSK